jgi:carboxypeptidase C (cathepsin A)
MKTFKAVLLAGALVCGSMSPAPLMAQDRAEKAEAKGEKAYVFPAPVTSRGSIRVASGRTVNYAVTAGSLPVEGADGERIADVAYTYYKADGYNASSRPITFVFNGGPGSASVWLHLGVVGPKRLSFGANNQGPSISTGLLDNPDTWLDYTDLVFVDPVGTGFSRVTKADDAHFRQVYGVDQDVRYLSRIIADFLLRYERMSSPKYLAGESYGGFRVPKIARRLTTEEGVGIRGQILISPLLDRIMTTNGDISPLPWVVRLPPMVASAMEVRGQVPSAESLREVEQYARTQYMADLMRGRDDPAAVERLSQKMAAYTGLDINVIRQLGGRLDNDTYTRELFRKEGKLASRYDTDVTAFDPWPNSPERRAGDPSLESIDAPATSAMVDYTTRVLGWKVTGKYESLSSEVGPKWDWGRNPQPISAVNELRQYLALDPDAKVLVVHGFTDMQTSYFSSRLIIDQMPAFGDPNKIRLVMFPGGHMFYSRDASRSGLRREVETVFR